MYTDWIGWRGRRGDELPAAGGAARFKPDQGVEARPLLLRRVGLIECIEEDDHILRATSLDHQRKEYAAAFLQRAEPSDLSF